MEILKGHTSPETAVVVDDYPYGFTLRCKIRYWLEFKPKKGFRLVSQTTNPKIGDREVWNRPKASTYVWGPAVLVRESNGYIDWRSSHFESLSAEQAQINLDVWRDALPASFIPEVEKFIRVKARYTELMTQGVPYQVAARMACIEEARRKSVGSIWQ